MKPIKKFLEKVLPAGYISKLKQIKIWMLKQLGRDLDYFYNEDFVAMKDLRDKMWTKDFCEVNMRIFDPGSIIDFGCGTADILAPFEAKGLVIKGVDGSSVCQNRAMIKKENFELFDIRHKYNTEFKYDLCLCLEVAEHIEEKYSDVLVGNLTGVSHTVIFTAAPPGQEGVHHINLKTIGWWIEKFEKRGFSLNRQRADLLKKEMRDFSGVQNYYIDNLLVFQKT